MRAATRAGAAIELAQAAELFHPPSSEALQSTLNVIEAKAHFDAPECLVHIRVGGLDGRLYLDHETWRAVVIDTTGWRVIDNRPVRFRRAVGQTSVAKHGKAQETPIPRVEDVPPQPRRWDCLD
jgi:hypothetical protein